MLLAVDRWRTVDRAQATFAPNGPPPYGMRQVDKRVVDGDELGLVLLFGDDPRLGATSYWVHDPKKGWAGAFGLPELGPFDPER